MFKTTYRMKIMHIQNYEKFLLTQILFINSKNMNHPTNSPLPRQTHQAHQSHHPNPPPKQKIINSKDQAIQQLIYENTILKKQLSQLMLKTTAPSQFANINAVKSAMTSVRPSVHSLGSCMNSVQNTVQFNPNQLCSKGNNLGDKACEGRSQKQDKMIFQRQNKRAHRHSLDRLCQGYEGQLSSQINQLQPSKPSFGQNENQLKNSIPLVINQRQIKLQTNQNLANTMSSLKQQKACMIEQEMYREKITKLKVRKTSQSKRLSEEKTINKPACNLNSVIVINQNANKVPQAQQSKRLENSKPYKSQNQSIHCIQIQERLVKVHQVLKSKLKSPQISPRLNSKAKESISQKNEIYETFHNSIPLTHVKNPTQQKKMFPTTPNNFSQQKQNKEQAKVLIPYVNQQNSLKTIQRKQTEANSQQASRQNIKEKAPAVNEQKQVCLKQLRRRVYMDDQGQGGRTKRAVSKNNSNTASEKNIYRMNEGEHQEQITKRNHTQQGKQQLSQRINTVESEMAYIDAESLRKVNMAEKRLLSCTADKVMIKKNSNKVYLEEDEGDKHNIKNTAKNKQHKVSKDLSTPQKTKNIELEHNENKDGLVSIEDIHMIGDIGQIVQSQKQPVQTRKRSPPLSRQNSVNNQSYRDKNLYNQVYCESRKDMHS